MIHILSSADMVEENAPHGLVKLQDEGGFRPWKYIKMPVKLTAAPLMWLLMYFFLMILIGSGDGQVDFNEFMTILGPKLLSSETREGFLGNTIDTIFWQVNHLFAQLNGIFLNL